jgi:hypothetical protein
LSKQNPPGVNRRACEKTVGTVSFIRSSIPRPGSAKKRAAVTGDLIGVRVQPQMAKKLDDCRRKQADLPNRPDAIRRLVELGLKKGNSLHGRKPQQPVDATGDTLLRRMVEASVRPEIIAVKLNRTVHAVKARACRIGLPLKWFKLKAKGK